jgi:hypothetical protein
MALLHEAAVGDMAGKDRGDRGVCHAATLIPALPWRKPCTQHGGR